LGDFGYSSPAPYPRDIASALARVAVISLPFDFLDAESAQRGIGTCGLE